METKIKPRHIGDTTTIEFPLTERGRKYTIPAGAFLWLRMRALGGDANKIDKRALTAVEGATSAFFTPTSSDVDTPGVYHVQVFGTLAGGNPERKIACDIVIWEITDNLGALDFTHD
jgi:hypothetical protein